MKKQTSAKHGFPSNNKSFSKRKSGFEMKASEMFQDLPLRASGQNEQREEAPEGEPYNEQNAGGEAENEAGQRKQTRGESSVNQHLQFGYHSRGAIFYHEQN